MRKRKVSLLRLPGPPSIHPSIRLARCPPSLPARTLAHCPLTRPETGALVRSWRGPHWLGSRPLSPFSPFAVRPGADRRAGDTGETAQERAGTLMVGFRAPGDAGQHSAGEETASNCELRRLKHRLILHSLSPRNGEEMGQARRHRTPQKIAF